MLDLCNVNTVMKSFFYRRHTNRQPWQIFTATIFVYLRPSIRSSTCTWQAEQWISSNIIRKLWQIDPAIVVDIWILHSIYRFEYEENGKTENTIIIIFRLKINRQTNVYYIIHWNGWGSVKWWRTKDIWPADCKVLRCVKCADRNSPS